MRLHGMILAMAMLPMSSCKTESNIQKVPAPAKQTPVDDGSRGEDGVPAPYPAPGGGPSPQTASETATATATATACATGEDCGGGPNAASFDPSWCSQDGATKYMEPDLDFDADGQADSLCVDQAGMKSIRYGSGETWDATSPWCTQQGAKLTVSDENGDGRSDLVCTDAESNRIVAHATKDGAFDFEAGAGDAWCTHEGAKRFAGDFDGDGKPDEFCADAKGGKWWRYGRGTSQQAATLWCTHTGSWIEVFDSNGDGRTDLICRDGSGNRWESLARADGSFGFDP
jgi:hypothetical protein